MNYIKTVFRILVLVLCCLMHGEGQIIGPDKCESIYQNWHRALAAHPVITEPLFFRTNTSFNDLTIAVENIMNNRISMAYFVCQKIANDPKENYIDVLLLNEVSGVNLIYSEYATDNIGPGMRTNLARFRQEWNAGVYKDPSDKVARLCQGLLSKEPNRSIKPGDLMGIRRYGIFGLPELIRQIKQNNSKHAFAAYLIIAGKPFEYSEYLNHTDQQFINTDNKLNHIKQRFQEIKKRDDSDIDIVKQISAALGN